MSELFDKQVNAQNDKASGVHASSRKPTKKCVMKIKEKRNKKNDACIKLLLMEGVVYRAPVEKKYDLLQRISDTMKVLYA